MDYIQAQKDTLLAKLAGIDMMTKMLASQGRVEERRKIAEERREICDQLDAVEGALSIKK